MAFAYPTARPGFAPAAGLILALAGLTPAPAAGQMDVAFTQTVPPPFSDISVDEVNFGTPGNFTSLPLPSGLEFPWDIDFNAATDRFFVVGAAQDDGTAPPSRDFNFNDRGTIWSFDRDGGNPIQHASGLNFPQHLDVTSDGQTVFFAEQGGGSGSSFQDNGRIGRLDVATNAIETVVTAPVDAGPTGVHFDETNDTLFYQVNNRGGDIAMQQIRRVTGATAAANLSAGSDDLFLANPTPTDGTLDEAEEFTVVSAGRNVQVHDGFVYFTFRNGDFTPDSEIRRIPLDFDLSTDNPDTFETIIGPEAQSTRIIDFEIFDDQIYWTDLDDNSVFRANLDGTGRTLLAQGDAPQDFSSLSLPVGVAAVPDLLPGDLNNDGVVDGLDIDPFVAALTGGDFDPAADLNDDDKVDGLDIDPFVRALTGQSDAAMLVPEPGSAALLLLTAAGVGVRRRAVRPRH